MKLHEQWCEAGFHPDSFWGQTGGTLRSAMKGYQERVFKAVEIAGGKVNRGAKNGPSPERMKAHFNTMANKGLMTATKVA